MKWSSTRSLCMHVGGMILAQFESDIPLLQPNYSFKVLCYLPVYRTYQCKNSLNIFKIYLHLLNTMI